MNDGDYAYLNARVRAMGAELLTAEFYEQILSVESEDLLVDALLNSTYAAALREALTVRRGVAAVESALRRSFQATCAKILSIAPQEPRALLAVQLNVWDAANVVTLVRGKLTRTEPEDIMAGVLPAGELDEAKLAELAAEPDLAALADALTTWGYRFAFALRRAILDKVAAKDLAAAEAAVGEAYFRWAAAQLAGDDANVSLARSLLQKQTDLVNVKAALDRVRHRARNEEVGAFAPLAGGHLASSLLAKVAACTTLVDAFELLADTYFAPGVERGILAFGRSQSLGVMERFLEIVVIEAGCRLFRGDPLSAAVPLGFLWRKYSEFQNLRILMRGKSYRMPADAIREELMIA